MAPSLSSAALVLAAATAVALPAAADIPFVRLLSSRSLASPCALKWTACVRAAASAASAVRPLHRRWPLRLASSRGARPNGEAPRAPLEVVSPEPQL